MPWGKNKNMFINSGKIIGVLGQHEKNSRLIKPIKNLNLQHETRICSNNNFYSNFT